MRTRTSLAMVVPVGLGSERRGTLTNDNGAPVGNVRDSQTAGAGGPVLLEDGNLVQRLIVTKLVKAGADPNEKNRFGQTPLMFAALFGRTAAYDALVALGADEDTKDRLGQTARGLRPYQGDAKAVEGFLRKASHEVATFAAASLGVIQPTSSHRP